MIVIEKNFNSQWASQVRVIARYLGLNLCKLQALSRWISLEVIWISARNKALTDFWCNLKFPLWFTRKCKAIWKENWQFTWSHLGLFSRPTPPSFAIHVTEDSISVSTPHPSPPKHRQTWLSVAVVKLCVLLVGMGVNLGITEHIRDSASSN